MAEDDPVQVKQKTVVRNLTIGVSAGYSDLKDYEKYLEFQKKKYVKKKEQEIKNKLANKLAQLILSKKED